MAGVKQEFLNSPMFRSLKHRSWTMAQMVGHVEDRWEIGKENWIIETGTAWDPDNWDGQGQSTIVWDWLAERIPEVRVVSIDIRKEASEYARGRTSSNRVQFIVQDSIQALSELPRSVVECTRLLYLDSFDWTPQLNMESSYHHMAEFAAVWAALPSGCLVVVDDRHSNTEGKHVMVQGFFRKIAVKPLFCEYQVGWVKP